RGVGCEARWRPLTGANRALAGERGRGSFRREAALSFDVGAGTQDLAHRAGVSVLFTCRPSVPLTLEVSEERGRPAVAGFVITDRDGRTYPAKAKRLAPDFFFHPQIYRKSGESVSLPPGRYQVAVSRG